MLGFRILPGEAALADDFWDFDIGSVHNGVFVSQFSDLRAELAENLHLRSSRLPSFVQDARRSAIKTAASAASEMTKMHGSSPPSQYGKAGVAKRP